MSRDASRQASREAETCVVCAWGGIPGASGQVKTIRSVAIHWPWPCPMVPSAFGLFASAWRMQSRAHDDDGPMAGSPFRNEAAATDDGWWIKIAKRHSVARTLLGPMTVCGSERAGLTVFRTRGSATKARYELHATGHPWSSSITTTCGKLSLWRCHVSVAQGSRTRPLSPRG